MPAPAFDANFWPDVIGQGYERREVFRTWRSPRETAGDQKAQAAGSNILVAYTLGWRNLGRDSAEALLHAEEMLGGEADGIYFLEWRTRAEANVLLGTGTGTGSVQFALQGYMPAGAVAAGLQVTRNGTPIVLTTDYTVQTDTGNRYVQNLVTILAAANVAGATYRANWSSARRRRHVRLDGALESEEKRESVGGSLRWSVTAKLIETEAAA